MKPLTRVPAAGQIKQTPLRFVVFHIHPVSARLRMLKTDANHLCLPVRLPTLSALLPSPHKSLKVSQHPGYYFSQCCEMWQLPEKEMTIAKELKLWVETPSGHLPVYFLQVKGNQIFSAPPGTAWMELPECFCLAPLERDILQALYQWLLE